jgi:hypothetical protein
MKGARMDEYVTIRINRDDLGQIADGLQVLLEQWQATRAYFRDEASPQDVIIRDCNDLEEAELMCKTYKEIIDVLWKFLARTPKGGRT